MTESDSGKPGVVYGGLVPTKNHRGFMSATLDYLSLRFAEYAGHCEAEVLDIGCAYGIATHAALERGAWVMACDMEPEHLRVLAAETPGDARDRLRTRPGTLPDVDFREGEFGAILCSRVLHFMLAVDLRRSLEKMYRWLQPGGRLFVVADTPYTGFWSSTAPDYERRKAAGEEWPGLIADISTILGEGRVPEGMLPYLNPLDPDILRRECERAGFSVLEALFTGRDGALEGRQHAAVVATR